MRFLQQFTFVFIAWSVIFSGYAYAAQAITNVVLSQVKANTITTFAHPFRQGDVPQDSTLQAYVAGASIPLQVDVKTRWPDGSIKHAVLSVQIPKDHTEVQLDLERKPAPQIQTRSLSLIRNLLQQAYAFSVELELPRQTLRVNVADLLEAQLQDPSTRLWLEGELVQEVRLLHELSPEMRAIIDLRVDKTGSVRTALSIHNDVLYENTNEAFRYDARILLGNTTVWEQLGIRHFANTNWREIIWSGAPPSQSSVRYDMEYLVASRLIPPYDVTLDLEPQALERWIKPLDRSAFQPFASNDVHVAMPDTGYRPDLGMLPLWSVVALISQDPNAMRRMKANGAAAGGIPWHFRDSVTDRPVTLAKHPRVWFDYRATPQKNGHVAPDYQSVHGWKVDSAHMPDLNYLPYLLTGDRYFLDELQFQVNWAQLHSTDPNRRKAAGLWANDQVRAQGWQLRSMTYAAQITPDTDPLKSHYEITLEDRLNWYILNHIQNATYGAPKGAEIAGWVHGYSVDKPGMMKPFMQDFFAMPIAYAALLGYEDAITYTHYMSNFYAGRFTQDAFDPIHANTYSWGVVDSRGNKLMTWQQVADVNFASGKFKQGATELGGYPHLADAAAGSARGGLGLMAGVLEDPLTAEAYAYVVSQTPGMDGRISKGKTFARAPQWAIVPTFPDGSLLPLSAMQIGGNDRDEMTAGDDNALLMGMQGDDTLRGGTANSFLVGWDGDDTIEVSDGYSKVSGGRGDDTVVVTGGTAHVRLGSGNDVIHLGDSPLAVTVYDYTASEDVIKLSRARYDQDGTQGWLWEKNADGNYALVFSDGGQLVMRNLDHEQLQDIKIDIY